MNLDPRRLGAFLWNVQPCLEQRKNRQLKFLALKSHFPIPGVIEKALGHFINQADDAEIIIKRRCQMPTLDIENSIWDEGYDYIAFCDEVGRGCLFGSVLAAAVIMPKGLFIEGVRDSKKLSPKKREQLYEIIKKECIAMGVGMVSSEIIDKINIKNATRLAMKKAVMSLKDRDENNIIPDYILVDAEEIELSIPQMAVIKGDDFSHGIAASSIVAKVLRDRLCERWDMKYPGYNIKQNKGYGTKEHREALRQYGASPMHRKTFLGKIL